MHREIITLPDVPYIRVVIQQLNERQYRCRVHISDVHLYGREVGKSYWKSFPKSDAIALSLDEARWVAIQQIREVITH